jgi:hypothetical protein
MKTIEEEKLELIKNAKAGAIDDFTRMSATLEEIIERVVHYAYDAGYEKGILDYISGNVPDL